MNIFGDSRAFMESYNPIRSSMNLVFMTTFVQDNHSLSVEAGVLRGLHYPIKSKAPSKSGFDGIASCNL